MLVRVSWYVCGLHFRTLVPLEPCAYALDGTLITCRASDVFLGEAEEAGEAEEEEEEEEEEGSEVEVEVEASGTRCVSLLGALWRLGSVFGEVTAALTRRKMLAQVSHLLLSMLLLSLLLLLLLLMMLLWLLM
ncbi:unnamed protein product [Polarella glacialis]|uniref:Uncharacterized protein n=1 Tax=Polarella glacialis TaxID=89957 RepID=A0A813JIL8_POLGL|nr:unnamed protein product [Polarella glacialis]